MSAGMMKGFLFVSKKSSSFVRQRKGRTDYEQTVYSLASLVSDYHGYRICHNGFNTYHGSRSISYGPPSTGCVSS